LITLKSPSISWRRTRYASSWIKRKVLKGDLARSTSPLWERDSLRPKSRSALPLNTRAMR
jgi:hypothetical protein